MTALPWPAWHTDDSDAAHQRFYGLSDAELLKAKQQAELFWWANMDEVWRFSHEEWMRNYTVMDRLRRCMADRFEEIVGKRQQAASAAVLTRAWNRRARGV